MSCVQLWPKLAACEGEHGRVKASWCAVLLSRISHKHHHQFAAQGLSRPAVVSLHPLALEGFVSCACAPVACLVPNLSIPLRPRAAGGGEQHVRILSKAQHTVGPVPSRPAEANHLSGCNKRSRWAAPKPLPRLHSARCLHRSQLGLMYS